MVPGATVFLRRSLAQIAASLLPTVNMPTSAERDA